MAAMLPAHYGSSRSVGPEPSHTASMWRGVTTDLSFGDFKSRTSSVSSFLARFNGPDYNGELPSSPYRQGSITDRPISASPAPIQQPIKRPNVRDVVMAQLPAERQSYFGHIVAPGGYGKLTLSISPSEIGDLMLRHPDIRTTQGLIQHIMEERKWSYTDNGGIVKSYEAPHEGYVLDLSHCLDVRNQLQDDIDSILRKVARATAQPASAYPQHGASPTGYPPYHQPSNNAMHGGGFGAVMPGYAPPPPPRPAAQQAQRPPVANLAQARPAAAMQHPSWLSSNSGVQTARPSGKSTAARFSAFIRRGEDTFRKARTWLNTAPAATPQPTVVQRLESNAFTLHGVPVRLRVKVSDQQMSAYVAECRSTGRDIDGADFLRHLEGNGNLNMDIARDGSSKWDAPRNWLNRGEKISWNSITVPPALEARLFDTASRMG